MTSGSELSQPHSFYTRHAVGEDLRVKHSAIVGMGSNGE